MTATAARVAIGELEARPVVDRKRWGTLAMKLLTTTDHKVIGNMYYPTQTQIHAEIAAKELKQKTS